MRILAGRLGQGGGGAVGPLHARGDHLVGHPRHVGVVDVEGYRRVDDGTLGDLIQRVVDDRRGDPGGTRAERLVTGEGDAR